MSGPAVVLPMRSSRSIPFPHRVGVMAVLAAALVLTGLLSAQSAPPPDAAIIAALRSGQNQQALQLCEQRLRHDPQDAQAWILQGMALDGLGQPQKSLPSFQHALRLRPRSLPALEGAAQAAYQTGSPQAPTLLHRLLKLQPENPTAHAMLAALAFQQKNCPEAIRQFQRSGSALEQTPQALAQYGDCLIRTQQPAAAEAIFQKWLALQPESAAARYDLGLSQHLGHHDHDAVATLHPLLEESSAYAGSPKAQADLLNLLAATEEGDHQTSAAVAHLRQAILLAPSDPRNYLDLATIALVHHSYQVGIDVLNTGLQVLPGDASLAVARGVLYAQTGRYDLAESDFEKAQEARAESPHPSAATVGMGIALMQSDHVDSAIRLLRQKLAAHPTDPDLNYLLAVALQRKGMAPGSAAFQEAVAALEKALRQRPGFAEARDELSALELRAGEPAKAAEDARLAMQLKPESTSAVYHRMMALRQLKRTQEASALAQRLAQLQTEAQQQEVAIDRVHLVEMPDAAHR